MNVYCTECGLEMSYEEQAMSPGSNDPCIVVTPCCVPEPVRARIDYLDNYRIDGMFESVLNIDENIVKLLRPDAQGQERRDLLMDIANLKNTIKELVTEGILG